MITLLSLLQFPLCLRPLYLNVPSLFPNIFPVCLSISLLISSPLFYPSVLFFIPTFPILNKYPSLYLNVPLSILMFYLFISMTLLFISTCDTLFEYNSIFFFKSPLFI